MMSRRGLLFTGSAAVALSMVGNRPLLAVAAEEDRYATVLRQATDLVTSAREFQHLPEYTGLELYDRWSERADVLIRDLIRLFPEKTDRETIMQVCNGMIPTSTLNVAELRETVPALVPIMMTREMVQKYNAPFHMIRQKSFMDFAEHYREHFMA